MRPRRDRSPPAGRPARSARSPKAAALDRDRLDPAGRRAARQAPLRPRVAGGAADRVLAERVAGPRRVQRIDAPGPRGRGGRPRACTRSARRPRPAAAAARGRCRRSRRTACGRRRHGSSAPGGRGRPRRARRRSASPARPAGTPARRGRRRPPPRRPADRQRRQRRMPAEALERGPVLHVHARLTARLLACGPASPMRPSLSHRHRQRQSHSPSSCARISADASTHAGARRRSSDGTSRRQTRHPARAPARPASPTARSASRPPPSGLRARWRRPPARRGRPGAGGRRWCRGGP